ncbi:MAG TPA: 3-isopropylmalate dehydratase small subunit [Vicinamibacterales bacterium]
MAIEKITRVEGRALPIRGDNIDTDRIIPARFLRSVTFEGLEDHLFEDDRVQAPGHPLDQPRFKGASILLVNANFGCGSSREHAPQAIRRHGFRAVVGQSFSEIFFGNSVALGMPCVTMDAASMGRLMDAVEADPASTVSLDIEQMIVSCAEAQYRVSLPAAARDSFLAGTWDATALLLDKFEDVEAVAARLPYVKGW